MFVFKKEIDIWIARLIWVSFFLPAQIQTILIIAWSLWMVWKGFQNKVTISKQTVLVILGLGLGYWFYLAWLPFTDLIDRPILFSYLERKVSLVLLPLIVYLSYKTCHKSLYSEMSWFVWGCLAKFVLANIYIFQRGMLQPEIFQRHVLYRNSFNEIAQIHPTYFGIYIVFSLAILIWRGKEILKEQMWLLFVFQALLVIFLLVLSPKAPMLAALCIYVLALFCLHNLSFRHKVIICLGFIFLLITSWFTIPYLRDRVKEVSEFVQKEPNTQIGTSMEIRNLIFETDIQLLKEHWLVGLGPAQLEAKLNTAFLAYSIYLKKSIGSYNTHNELLNQWLCFGILGITYFFGLLFFHARKAIRQKNYLYISFIIIFFISCLTENVLSRQQGIIFFALISSVFFLKEHKSGIQLTG